MQLKFRNQYREFIQPVTAEDIIGNINDVIGSDYLFSHVNADGIEIYDNQEQFLSNNLPNIQVLEIIAYTSTEFISNSLRDAENYLEGAIKEFDTLSDGFYNTPGTDEWTKFSEMLEGMQWINLVISSIDHLKEKPENWSEFTSISDKLQSELRMLEEAIEKNDFVLIADLIQYELLPLYEMLDKEIKKALGTKGLNNNVN